MATPDVPERWVTLAADAIDGEEASSYATSYYSASHRVDADHAPGIARAALAPALADLRRHVEALDPLHDVLIRRDAVLDLLNTGGSDA